MDLEHLTSFRFSMERICADPALAACLILLDLSRSEQLQQKYLAGNPQLINSHMVELITQPVNHIHIPSR